MTEEANQGVNEEQGAGGDDAAAAAAAATAKAEGDKAGAEAAEGGETGKESGHDFYKPEGLADHLLGTSDKETIDKLNDAYKGAREALSKKGNKAPETPDGYKLELGDDVRDKIVKLDENGKDPVFEAMKPVLHETGLSNEGVNKLINGFYKVVAARQEAAAEAAANDPNAADVAFKSLGGEDKAKPLQDASNAWINGIKDQLALDPADVQELQYLTQHSQGLKVLNKLRGLTSEKPIPADFSHGNPERLVTQVDIDEMMNDERYRAGDAEWHAAVREKITQKQAQKKA